MKVAAVTIAYNEPDFLPIWVRHYASQVGPRHCYVIDHGSDDGSTDAIADINVVRIPRSPCDDDQQARFISTFCASLLEWYDYVVHSDVDEIVVADPGRHTSLQEYCESCQQDVVTAIGYNLVQTSEDLPIDLSRKILEQRKWMYFLGPMCKPALTRRPIVWGGGFHQAHDVEPRFADLHLFHLRFVDQQIGLRRLAKTRVMARANMEVGWWQRVSDEKCLEMMADYANLPQNANVNVSNESIEVLDAISQVLGSSGGRLGEPDTLNLGYEMGELWQIPERFQRVF